MESGLGIISWIIFGALAGWVASLIAGTRLSRPLGARTVYGAA